VAGVPQSLRREYLNDYLQHKLVLANAGPAEIEPARAYLRAAYSPLANGAWPRETAWGWTMVPFEQMAAYVSAQVDAMRTFSAVSGLAADHWGFAWAPRNTTGLSNADFAAQTGQILDRLAAAVRDSAIAHDPEVTGSGACGPGETLCAVDLPDARHNEAWRSFRAWAQAALTISGAPATIGAGIPSPPLTLSVASSVGLARSVSLSSSSAQGTFSTSPAGPWTRSLALVVSPTAPGTFYYRDTLAGSHTITASAPGVPTLTQGVTVVAGPAVAIKVTPSQSTVVAQATRRLAASATDAFGNTAASAVTWSVTPPSLGTIAAGAGGAAVFTARRVLGAGTITASADGLTGTAAITVLPGTLRIASLKATASSRGLRVLVGVADRAGRPISRATLTLVARQGDRRVFRGQVVTGSGGKALFRVRVASGCYRVVLTRAVAPGFRATGATPSRRVCRR
jgi:hypothetical protein